MKTSLMKATHIFFALVSTAYGFCIGFSVYASEQTTLFNTEEQKEIINFTDDNPESDNLNEFSSLKKHCNDNDIAITKTTSNLILDTNPLLVQVGITNDIMPLASSTYNLSRKVPRTFKQDGFSVTYITEISGSVRVNENTGVITSYSGPYITLISSSLVGNNQLQNVSTEVEWGSLSHRSIKMSGSYTFNVSFVYSSYPFHLSDSVQTISVSY